jgi:hypothetical protein
MLSFYHSLFGTFSGQRPAQVNVGLGVATAPWTRRGVSGLRTACPQFMLVGSV